MTRINVVPVTELSDQHLMAEYRELPMVLFAAKRSNPSKHQPSTAYTLNKGHVLFFYNKKKWLVRRYFELMAELHDRGYQINPGERNTPFHYLDKYDQNDKWHPDDQAVEINRSRIQQRLAGRPGWYRWHGQVRG